VVIELTSDDLLRFPLLPLDVVISLRSNGIAHDVSVAALAMRDPVTWILAENCQFPRSIRFHKQRLHADAFDSDGSLQATHVCQRWVDVDQFDQSSTLPSGILLAGNGENQRNSGRPFEVIGLCPQALFTEMIAVVTPQHDNGVVLDLCVPKLASSRPTRAST